MRPFEETIPLVERRPTICRLAPATVDHLLAHHRDHLEVLPTRRRHRYRVTALGHVGILTVSPCRFVIQPKIPVANLFHLLDPEAELAWSSDPMPVEPGTEAFTFLVRRFTHLLGERFAVGLQRGYVERSHQGTFLQGRLDLAAQLADPTGRRDHLHSRFEEFTTDVPCNQIVKAVVERLLSSPLTPDPIRGTLRSYLGNLAEVRSLPLGPSLWTASEPTPLTEGYRLLLDTGRLLVEALDPVLASGAASGPAFLLDMERVFERYVTRAMLPLASTRLSVEVQPSFTANVPIAGQPDIVMRPDVVLFQDGRPWMIVDAKWKRLSRSGLPTNDLYQVLAYGAALGVERVILVYPGRRCRVWDYAFPHGSLRVKVATLRVEGNRAQCLRGAAWLRRSAGRASV